MRLIDVCTLADILQERHREVMEDPEISRPRKWQEALSYDTVRREIDKAVVVDAVPVVRCRDCKHRGTNGCPMHINGRLADEAFLRTVDDDYCSYGERCNGEAVLGV